MSTIFALLVGLWCWWQGAGWLAIPGFALGGFAVDTWLAWRWARNLPKHENPSNLYLFVAVLSGIASLILVNLAL
jgi:hypothetical protein